MVEEKKKPNILVLSMVLFFLHFEQDATFLFYTRACKLWSWPWVPSRKWVEPHIIKFCWFYQLNVFSSVP